MVIFKEGWGDEIVMPRLGFFFNYYPNLNRSKSMLKLIYNFIPTENCIYITNVVREC